MNVIPIPCLADNYAYLLEQDGHAVVVDPSEAGPVLAALAGLTLDAIWCTHHHWDHINGVPGLLERHAVPVIGSRHDHDQRRIPGQTIAVEAGDTVPFGPFQAHIRAIPGHTLGAIAFQIEGELFTGDTLLAGGCGRVFEGTLPMMQASLAQLRSLDPTLRVWCGHEYTVKNLEFAQSQAPDPAVSARLGAARAQRAQSLPTVGSTLAEEVTTNPFLRWDDPAIIATARRLGALDDGPAEVFGAWRTAKDRA